MPRQPFRHGAGTIPVSLPGFDFQIAAMIRLPFISAAVLAALTLPGCDSRPVVGTEKTPFTVAGVTLGMDKEEVRAMGRLGTCRQENERVASCSYKPEKERVLFMGENVEWITYEFMDDSPKVGVIKVSTLGNMISDLSFRWDWKMEGRCVDDYAADTIRKFSRDGWYAVERINEMKLRRYSGFSCMSEDGRYVAGSAHNSGSDKKYSSSVEMFMVNSYAADAMNSVFAVRQEIEAKNKTLNASPGS